MPLAEAQAAEVVPGKRVAVVSKVLRLADALRLKDAEQRDNPVVAWPYLTDVEKTKWTELALVALETE